MLIARGGFITKAPPPRRWKWLRARGANSDLWICCLKKGELFVKCDKSSFYLQR